jgi:trehalose 6-phosphate phosphatase
MRATATAERSTGVTTDPPVRHGFIGGGAGTLWPVRKISTGGPPGSLTADQAWQATRKRADQCVLFFDFDGTLAPVQADPESVCPVPAVVPALAALGRRVRQVAIVSARPVEFLRDRFAGVNGLDFYGLYGLEHARSDSAVETVPDALPWIPVMAELAERARAALPSEALVEYKRLSVALHYRTAPHLAGTLESWARTEAERRGLRVQPGRMVVELKPPVDRDKGMVISELLGDAGCAWYFGDDVSDLKAFAALRARKAADPDFLGVCVAVHNPETGDEVARAADLTFASPDDLGDFLARLD